MHWRTTTTLLNGLSSSGSNPAWSRLNCQFHTPLVDLGRHMGLPLPEAEDAAQETLTAFSVAYRSGRYDRSKGRLSKWLFGIAVRQIRHARRKLARREAALLSPGAAPRGAFLPVDSAGSPADALEETWELALLKACQDRVRREVQPRVFQAFAMVVHEGQSPAGAADQLGVPVKWVYNAKHRVLRRIRALRARIEVSFEGDGAHEVS